jgi:hypothetical protein
VATNQPTKQTDNYPIIEPLQIFCWTYWTFQIWRSAISDQLTWDLVLRGAPVKTRRGRPR